MAYFIPSSIQKRLLRYALSRLELLDTDALDLESLDIAWGKRSTVELKDVGLRLKKLRSLLQLPDRLELNSARISRLRVTVPAEIHTSSIVVEISGVKAQLDLPFENLEAEGSPITNEHSPKFNKRRNDGQRNSRFRSPPPSNKGGPASGQDDDNYIPTPHDLAMSFLQEEPTEERKELEAALSSQSQILHQSVSSAASSEDDTAVGLGTGLALPGFLASFLKGIGDRLQVEIRDVSINLNVSVPLDFKGSESKASSISVVTLQLSISDLNVHSVSQDANSVPELELPEASAKSTNSKFHIGKRCISFKEVQGFIVCDRSLFGQLSGASDRRSPNRSAAGSPVLHRSYGTQNYSGPQISPGTYEVERPVLSNEGRDPFSQPYNRNTGHGDFGFLGASVVSSEGGKFSDAAEEDANDGTPGLEGRYPEQGAYFGLRRAWSPVIPDASQSNYQDTDVRYYDDASGTYHGSLQAFREERLQRASQPDRVLLDDNTPPSGQYLDRLDAEADRVMSDSGNQTPRAVDMEGSLDLEQRVLSHSEESNEIDSLLESREFSHEEARSLYMSAMSELSPHPLGSAWPDREQPNISGHLRPEPLSGSSTSTTSLNDSSIDQGLPFSRHPDVSSVHQPPNDAQVHGITESAMESQHVQTAADSSVLPDSTQAGIAETSVSSSNDVRRRTIRILNVDCARLWLPSASDDPASDGLSNVNDMDQTTTAKSFLANQSEYRTVPGAFSQYAERTQRSIQTVGIPDTKAAQVEPVTRTTPNSEPIEERKSELELTLDSVQFHADLFVSRVMFLLTQRFSSLQAPTSTKEPQTPLVDHTTTDLKKHFDLYVNHATIVFFDTLQERPLSPMETSITRPELTKAWAPSPYGNSLFKLVTKKLKVQITADNTASTTKLHMANFTFGYPDGHIISFSKEASIRTSVRDLDESIGHDVVVSVNRAMDVLEVNLSTLPVKVDIDLQKLDETLTCFGGFSGLLELSSSITSAGPATTREKPVQSKPRTVRFETGSDSPISGSLSLRNKAQARIGGAHVTLRGKHASLTYRSTAIKVVGRDTLFGVRIDHAQVNGPHIHGSRRASPMELQFHDILFKFLFVPEEADLTKLLSLITPSKDKFEKEDDILVGTLLQQRRKGSVLRASVSKMELEVTDLNGVQALQTLAHEMAKLSTVTKYLPEDDRPGIMILGSIGDLNAWVKVDPKFGSLAVQLKGVEIGHVGLPALLALSIVNMSANRNTDQIILCEVLQQQRSDSPPMIMARMIGDELEPTAKLKLFNVSIEYSVPLALALLELSPEFLSDELILDLAQSIASLTPSPGLSRKNTDSLNRDNGQSTNSKSLLIDLVLRDCAIGLNPRSIPSKGLFVLTDVQCTGAVPTGDEISLSFALRKASYLVINDVRNIVSEPARIPTIRSTQSTLGSIHVPELCRQGYVSVASISAAKASLNQVKDADGEGTKVDVEFRDALLVLETCADSTETLGKIFDGLSLPSAPSSRPGFRTEAEDLMASALINAYGSDAVSERDEVFMGDDTEMVGLHDEEYDGEELMIDSGILHAFAGVESKHDMDPPTDSVVIEKVEQRANQLPLGLKAYSCRVGNEDPENFRIVSEDALLNDFKISTFDTAYVGPAHKWDSGKNKTVLVRSSEVANCPLKLKLQGIHIIWNLFDGYDWEKTRDTIAEAVRDIESRAAERRANRRRSMNEDDEEESVIGDFLFNSIYIGVANRNDHDLRRRINSNMDDLESETGSYASTATARPSHSPQPRRQRLKLARSKRHKITFELRGVSADVFAYKPGDETHSSIDINVTDLEIFDHVPTSTWKKFLTYMHDAGEREEGRPMIHLEICNVRPVPELTSSELVIKASVLPLRLHVDQDALDFITRFFEFSDGSSGAPKAPTDQPYLQRVEVEPVQLKLDYKPKKVDYAGLRSGHTTEFMNFFILDGADILLKHAIIYGVPGFARLNKDLNGVWMPDIRSNQLPAVLSGLTGVRSLVDVGTGLRDMIEIPIREYRRDGRLLRSLQHGALALGKTTSELARLGAKLATSAQTTLQGAETLFVRPETLADDAAAADDPDAPERRPAASNYADQPAGVLQGLRGAAEGLRREALLTRETIVAMSAGIRASGSAADVAGAVGRHAPTIVFRPVIGASRAIGQTLMGVTNALDPEGKRRWEDKYKRNYG